MGSDWEIGWWRDPHHKREVAKAHNIVVMKAIKMAKLKKFFVDSAFYGVVCGVALSIGFLVVFLIICTSKGGG